MPGTVYIAHCIDTEGPLYESLDASFERLEEIFGIKAAHTRENLKKLQNMELDCGGKEKAIADMLSEKRLSLLGSWHEIDEMLERITDPSYRDLLPDSGGKGWVYNWFCMSHAGFTGANPRRRDAGYHNIYDHYRSLVDVQPPEYQDHIYFHYHPLPFRGDYNLSATAYVAGSNLFEILARCIIDRGFFPAAFRPGFHTERPDSHWFLEQWIPFDYANQACGENNGSQEDLADGRFGDWRRAPKDWSPYHPSHDDYQKKGNCSRWIARCLNMDARIRTITQEDVDQAFEAAQSGKSVILSFTDHDFRDMSRDIDRVREMISSSSRRFCGVPFLYSGAAEAMRKVVGIKPASPGLSVDLQTMGHRAIVTVKADGTVFGPQPFFAFKTVTGGYYWDNLDFADPDNGIWTYTFDSNNYPIRAIEKIGAAANSPSGVSEIVVLDAASGEELDHPVIV